MKKRINLLLSKKKVHFLVLYGDKIKLLASIIGVFCFIVFIFLTIILLKVKNNINSMNDKKKLYLAFLVDNKDSEANVRYFKSKESQLTTFMKDDANFLPYYTILKEAVTSSSSTQSALLDSVSINKLRDTSFTVKFSNYHNMISFIKFIESNDFLSKFSQLSLANFTLNLKTLGISSYKYQLQFRGRFNQIQ